MSILDRMHWGWLLYFYGGMIAAIFADSSAGIAMMIFAVACNVRVTISE